MEEFIRRARQELNALWDQLYYSGEQRQKFKPAFTGTPHLMTNLPECIILVMLLFPESVADETLEAHEKEITRTHILIEDQKHILERVEKHMRLVEEIKQFEVGCLNYSLPKLKYVSAHLCNLLSLGFYVRSQSPLWQRSKGSGPTSPGREVPKTHCTRITQGTF